MHGCWRLVETISDAWIRGVTIRYPRDTIRIAIRGSRYDTYRDTCSNLHTIRIAIHGS